MMAILSISYLFGNVVTSNMVVTKEKTQLVTACFSHQLMVRKVEQSYDDPWKPIYNKSGKLIECRTNNDSDT